MPLKWPSLVMKEYEHWFSEKEGNRRCLNAARLNSSLNLKGDARFIENMPPCFLVGNVGESKTMLLSLNPGYKGERGKKEYEVFDSLGWKKAYLTFFDWFFEKGLSSPYYSRFAVFLSGYLGLDSFPPHRKERFELLGKNLINVDLIPYHSVSFKNSSGLLTKEKPLLESYVENLKELIGLANPNVIFINGAIFKDLLTSLGVVEKKTLKFVVNKRLDRSLVVYLGHMQIGDKKIKTIRFANFITSKSLAATNDCLFDAGFKLASE